MILVARRPIAPGEELTLAYCGLPARIHLLLNHSLSLRAVWPGYGLHTKSQAHLKAKHVSREPRLLLLLLVVVVQSSQSVALPIARLFEVRTVLKRARQCGSNEPVFT